MTGPYQNEREAAAAAQPALVQPMRSFHGRPRGMAQGCHRLLCEACTAAGVELGAYDHKILLWLAEWEPTTCAVIAGIIRRAAAAKSGSLRR